MTIWKSILAIILTCCCASVMAGLDPRASAGDTRVRVVPYSATNVVQILMHTGIGTTIQFFPGEQYLDHASGAAEAFTIKAQNSGDKIVIKPMVSMADTNLTVFTNQRTYLFELKIRDPKKLGNGFTNNVRDDKLTYMLYFTYPEEESRIANRQYKQKLAKQAQEQAQQCEQIGSVNPADLNFGYRMAGSRAIAPIAVYDDGVFTYFTFDQHAKIPSVFSADANREETTLNTRMEGQNVLVVEQLAQRFTLRLGNEVLTVMQGAAEVQASRLSTSEGSFNGW